MSIHDDIADDSGIQIAQLILESCYQENTPDHISVLRGKELRIGRNRDNDVYLDNSLISKYHFRIYSVSFSNDAESDIRENVFCQDLESRNGTYVNDLLIGRVAAPQYGFLLSAGDIISIKPYWSFTFHQSQDKRPSNFDFEERKEQEQFKNEFFISKRLLGTGATASVHLASHISTGKQLACKIVKLKKSGWQNVNAEIDILSKLDHPNIVTIRKAFISSHRVYIFQELAAGGDLFSYAESKDFRIKALDARIITRQIVRAIEFLHTKHITHRDLKIENILVTHNNDVGHRILITDFGHAFDYATMKQRMKSFVGTKDYMAPEILGRDREKGYTKAVDMWSIGIIVLILLTGECVIEQGVSQAPAEYVLRIIGSVLAEETSVANKWWLDMPEEARNFITNLLVYDARKRMTASQAVKHSWVTPKHLQAELLDLDRRARSYWQSKPANSGIKQYLSGVRTSSIAPRGNSVSVSPIVPRKRNLSIDATAAVHFGLDRHIDPRKPSNRAETLRKVRKSQNGFITLREPTEVNRYVHTQESDIILVAGNDIFRKSQPLKILAAAEEVVDLANVMNDKTTRDQVKNHGEYSDGPHADVEYETGMDTSKRRILAWENDDKDQGNDQKSRYFV